MTKHEMFEFINKNPIAFLATMEGNAPRVRAVMILRADEQGILFNTGRSKDLYKQIAANPVVEMCFYNREENVQLRVSGKLAPKDDEATRELILEKLPFLRPFVEKHGHGALAAFHLPHGAATRWTMPTNFEPKTFLEF